MSKVPALAILLIVVGVGSFTAVLAYSSYNSRPYSNSNLQTPHQQGMMSGLYTHSQLQSIAPITMDRAKTIAEQYLTSTGNSNLAIKEIMEFQYNFYVVYYEKDSGIGAIEMLIWKQQPASGMMGQGMMGWNGGNVAVGYMMPEPGPNMMWNTKYSYMSSGIMGIRYQPASTMTVSQSQAEEFAQAYLNANFPNAKTEMATQFYGYYTFDFTVNGKIAGMLSVNGNTGQVWYHSWHGDFIQEVEFD